MTDKIRVVELFAGIGAQRMALTEAGFPYAVVGISEIDRHALASYEAIHGDCPNLGDIRGIERLPPCDLLTASFPCQSISLAGKRQGMEEGSGTESSLGWEAVRLIETAVKDGRPPEYIVWENVPMLFSNKEFPNLLNRLFLAGYRSKWAKLDSSRFGSAQKRVRAFIVSRYRAEPPDLPEEVPGAPSLCLRDVMEPTRDERYVERIPLDRVRWRDPKGSYRHPQSEGIDCPLMDAGDPRIETRRIASEDSLCPTLRTGCPQKTVTKEEEERVRPGVLRADNLRMAPKGEKSVGTVSEDGVRMAVSPSEERRRERKGIRVVADWQREGRLELANRIYDEDGQSPAMVCHGGGNRDVKTASASGMDGGFLTVNKLTPREAWRLMGFPDWAYDRASEVCSETQLYNQAGNSIVVEVLVAIFRAMYGEDVQKGDRQTTLEGFL